MPFDVSVVQLKSLPRLAWLLRQSGNRIEIAVGHGVAITDTAIYEGGFAAAAAPAELRPEAIYFGSGAVWHDGTLTLISPSHGLESIWLAETRDTVWASNSFPLVVAATQPQDFDIRRLRAGIRSLRGGLSVAKMELFRGPDVRLLRFQNALVEIGYDGMAVERSQTQPLRFDSFGTYVRHLKDVLSETQESFSAESFAVYLSRGYDSPACAALARDVVPTTAICLDRSATGENDDGSPVARALGLPVHACHRRQRPVRRKEGPGWSMVAETLLPSDYDDVYEFFSGFAIGDEPMRVPTEIVEGRVVLTGWCGDAMWGLSDPVWGDFKRSVPTAGGGIGLAEFKLRAGFVHIPVPAIAFRHAGVVRTISTSDELAPWRLRTDYDRPIARRIVEEAGVPRELFGQRKMHATTKVTNLQQVAPILFDMQLARYRPALEEWPSATAHRSTVRASASPATD